MGFPVASPEGQNLLSRLAINDMSVPDFHYGRTASANAAPLEALVLHHTKPGPVENFVRYGQRVDEQRGGAFGYHFYVGPDGQIYQGAPLDKRTNHIKPPSHPARQGKMPRISNRNALGISLVGGEGGGTPEQRRAAVQLARALMADYGIKKFVGHGQLQNDRQPTEGLHVVEELMGGGGSDVAIGGSGQDYTLEEIEAEIARRQSQHSLEDIDAEIARRRVAAEGPSEQDRADVENALGQLKAEENPARAAITNSAAATVANTAGDSLMFGFGDNVAAGMDVAADAFLDFLGLSPDTPEGQEAVRGYQANLERRRGVLNEQRENNPSAALTGDLTGAVTGAAGLAKGGITLMRPGAGLGANMGRGAAEGAAYGLVHGAGQGDENWVEGAQQGGLVGMGLGAAAPLAVAALKQIPRAGRTVGNLFGVGSSDKRAERLLLEAIEQDEALLAPIPGKPDTLLDLAGDNTRRLAQVARGVPSSGGSKMTAKLEDRVISQGGRIADDAAEFLGASGDEFFQTTQDIIARRSDAVRPLYEALNGKSMPVTDGLADLVDRPAMQTALRRAAAEIKNRTGRSVDLSQNGVPFDLLNQAKKEIDALIRWDKSPMNSAQGANQSALKELQAKLLAEMDRGFKGYARARKVYAGETAIANAMEDGRAFIRGDVDEVAAGFADLSKSEKDAFRLGVARQLREMIEKTPDTSDAARKLINNEAMRKRLQIVSHGDDRFRKFVGALQRESQFVQTRNEVLRGSQTQPRQAAANAALAGAEAAFTGGTPGLLRVVKDSLIRRGRGIDKKTASRLAELVSSEDVDGVMRLLRSEKGRSAISRNLHNMEEDARNMLLRVIASQGATQ